VACGLLFQRALLVMRIIDDSSAVGSMAVGSWAGEASRPG
jgi:hypothetical protein